MDEAEELSEHHLIQLSVIRDEETDELVTAGHLSEDIRWDAPLNSTASFDYAELSLCITPGPLYPVAPVGWEITNHTMPIDAVDGLRRQLRDIVDGTASENSIDRFRTWLDNYDGSVFEYTKVVTLLVEETCRALEVFRAELLKRTPRKSPQPESALPFKLKEGVDIGKLSASEIAYRYLGMTPQEIAGGIPGEYRVRHIEEIVRKDLAVKFDRCRASLRQNMTQLPLRTLRKFAPEPMRHSNRVDDFADHIAKPRITYHGTQRRFVPNIVRHGFLRPGMKDPATKIEHEVRCGATYGRGIYSSPSPAFSLSYSDWWCTATKPDEYFGLKLIVCATLMGRSRLMFREDNWRTQSTPYWGADSHIGNSELEYIVFDPAQILPIYIIHLDWGEQNAWYFEDIPRDPTQWTSMCRSKPHAKLEQDFQYAGDKQRAKAAVMARASKYFPYGFGPATGNKFTVEEVGDVSEDDEEYGEYQELRVENKNHDLDSDYWSWHKYGEMEDVTNVAALEADEYRNEVRAYGPNWDSVRLPGEDDEVQSEDGDLHLSQLLGDT